MANNNNTTMLPLDTSGQTLTRANHAQIGSLSDRPGTQTTPPLFDILAEDGSPLWHACLKADARHLIKDRQALPEQYPRWQGRLATLPTKISAKQKAPRCFNGFPPGALDGCQPTLQFGGGSLGFGDDRPDVMIGFNGQVGLISAELALLHLDRFIEPGRMRLVVMAESHYGVVLERPATTMEVNATEPLYDVIGSCGVRLLSAVTLDVAHQTRDERQAEPDAYPEWQGELSFRLLRGAYLDKRAPT